MIRERESRPKQRAGKGALLAPLTTFRFFAALAIVFFHLLGREDYKFLASGVSFFFVLSGFVLTYVHPSLDEIGSWGRFWIARFARIWPLHFVTFILVLIFQPFGWLPNKHFAFEAVLNLSLLQCWIPINRVCESFNIVAWTLSVEALFYVCFPILLPFVFRRPLRLIIAAILLNIALSTAGAWSGLPRQSLNSPSYQGFLLCPALHLFEFVLGMAVAVWWLRHPKMPGLARRLEIPLFFGVVLVLPWLDLLAKMMTFGHSEYYLDSQLANLLRAPLFALLIYVFAFQAGILSRIFSHPWLVYLGEISFSIYMVHCIVMELYRRWCTPQIHVVSGAIYFLVVFAISSLLFTVLEKPARKAVARLLEGWFGLRRPARN